LFSILFFIVVNYFLIGLSVIFQFRTKLKTFQ